MKVCVIGGSGLVGRVTVNDLLRQGKDVKVIDVKPPKIKVDYSRVDISDVNSTSREIKQCDFVVNAAQYYFNLKVMEASLIAGVSYADLGGLFWMTKEQLPLSEKFEKEGILGVVGIGAEPGITNVSASYLVKKYGTPRQIKFRNGWITKGNKFNWSIDTQLDEATMSAVVWEEDKYVKYPPFSKSELFKFSNPVGEVKVYLTIHSELATIPYSFPGVSKVDWMEGGEGIETLRLLANLGFGDKEEVMGISPRKYLRSLLEKKELLGSNPDGWESAVTTVDNKHGIEVLMPPQGEFDGTQLGAGSAPAVALEVGMKGEGVLPPEKTIEPEPFLNSLKRRGFKVFFF
ncbi:saccharopine dehydrogenase NADP-binding domain-containing protein [Acidianus sp. RZ1]|uniref:saccharopine dehydrogenase NADP-binding domain-containing protein n=1 Tax=Acidianus sp. RZ1 TaxID=1540082 RepID=UPI0014927C7B|nr:saccharopine dehydrogenase NADP-binding domain-containing protein [Acidianus sp. RZ1]NON62292.1 NAD-dependent epimerase/dehydratase family protein [Acidianus sp. RZ1]